MASSGAALREKLARIGAVKRATLADDTERFLALPPGERLAVTVRHCDAHIAAFGSGADEGEAEVWSRVRRRLAGRA